MTQEEKAKAYDKALEIAKAWYKLDNNDLCNDDLETLFPELKESEDERIRKTLIKFHKSTIDIDGIKGGDIIAWLEKQGNKPQGKTTRQADIDIPFGARDSELQEASYHIPEGFHAEIDGDKVVIKKGKNPSWSEGDDAYKLFAISAVEDYYDKENPLHKDLVDWLQSLENRVIPQQKEWNKEDEQIALSVEQVMNCAALLNIAPEKIDKVRTWLQSLKQRVRGE